MRKIALILSAFGFVAFAGAARADQKTEHSEKTETSTTLTGKQKTTKTKKIERADGSTTEVKTETVTPKTDKREVVEKRAGDRPVVTEKREVTPVRHDSEASEKTEQHTTLTGKKQTKSTKKIENADGSRVETTTTTTEGNKK